MIQTRAAKRKVEAGIVDDADIKKSKPSKPTDKKVSKTKSVKKASVKEKKATVSTENGENKSSFYISILEVSICDDDEGATPVCDDAGTVANQPTQNDNSIQDDEDWVPKKKRTRSTIPVTITPRWKDHELLQDEHRLAPNVAKCLTQMFAERNTIPFIARYRKGATNNMSPEDLREIKASYDQLQVLKVRMQFVYKRAKKCGPVDDMLREAILSARNMETLEHIYAPYKVEKVRSLAKQAADLGLEPLANEIMEGTGPFNLQIYVRKTQPGLEYVSRVKLSVIHLIAQKIVKHPKTLSCLHTLKMETYFSLQTKQKGKFFGNAKDSKLKRDMDKFSLYFNFRAQIMSLKPHQILAINRGERLKVLSVKIIIPEYFLNKFKFFCISKWGGKEKRVNPERIQLMDEAIGDAYTRIVVPLIKRELRAELKNKAEKAAIEVFSGNLKQLLLGTPLRSTRILGIDPGFTNGCKLALISETGDLLDSAIINPHRQDKTEAEKKLRALILKYNCDTIALGNGTACRETENWLSELNSKKVFKPLEVSFAIVSEQGASIYSCSDEAKKEFPILDPNIISAVSIARRLQDPLSELVKIEPMHLGVGMYQHDISPKRLEEALTGVVSECVSFVGVDVNSASHCLLKYVAGITDRRATEIITHRKYKGPFETREDLKKVNGVGKHVFQQCAGFLKVKPDKTYTKRQMLKSNPLDNTIIHPETYETAMKIIKELGLDLNDMGRPDFIDTVEMGRAKIDKSKFSTEDDLELIFDGLSKPFLHDIRDECAIKTLFKKGVQNVNQLQIGVKLTGSVCNVTHFGCFVDIGVGYTGLIHTSMMKGADLGINDHVEVQVISLELDRKRIGLEFCRKF